MTWSRGPNLFAAAEAPATAERFDELARMGNLVVERIVSSESPASELYDQPQDEWVVLLRGEATLDIAGTSVALSAGDTLLLPRHTPHRVLTTSAGALWLAVHAFPASAT